MPQILPFSALACPLDGAPLHPDGQSWRCDNGHNFDIAREGYIHLLPVQKKRSSDPGDSREMVLARRRFLNTGFYAPIAEAVSQAALSDAPGALACLDAGCGEGYYLRQLPASASPVQRLELLGLDISKWAIVSAAKQDKGPRWVVGSNANLPVLPATLDRVLCIFGFPVYPEFARVLKLGGLLLQIDPGADHLRELREIIYPVLKTERVPRADAPQGFELQASRSIGFTLKFTGAADIADLLAMTPHLYRANAEGRERASQLTELAVTVDVRLNVFKRADDIPQAEVIDKYPGQVDEQQD